MNESDYIKYKNGDIVAIVQSGKYINILIGIAVVIRNQHMRFNNIILKSNKDVYIFYPSSGHLSRRRALNLDHVHLREATLAERLKIILL